MKRITFNTKCLSVLQNWSLFQVRGLQQKGWPVRTKTTWSSPTGDQVLWGWINRAAWWLKVRRLNLLFLHRTRSLRRLRAVLYRIHLVPHISTFFPFLFPRLKGHVGRAPQETWYNERFIRLWTATRRGSSKEGMWHVIVVNSSSEKCKHLHDSAHSERICCRVYSKRSVMQWLRGKWTPAARRGPNRKQHITAVTLCFAHRLDVW